MNTAQTSIFAAISKAQLSVKQIASACSISETSVRDNLKKLEGVQTDGGKPALFWIPAASEVIEAAPAAAEEGKETPCPFCPADHSSITAAGADHTFLGDSCSFCHECGRAHNNVTREEVIIPEGKGKRTVLNPQPAIDKKAAELEALGGAQSYASRIWTITFNGTAIQLTSKQYSTYKTGAQLIALF